jgi:hypothetical protein
VKAGKPRWIEFGIEEARESVGSYPAFQGVCVTTGVATTRGLALYFVDNSWAS